MEPKPRILILSTAYLPLIGGSELAIRNITDRLPEFDFDMVTGRYSADMAAVEQIGRIRVFRAGGLMARLKIFLPKALMPLMIAIKALRLMRKNRYSLIHAYQASQAAGAIVLIKLFHPRIPFLLTIQEGKELERQSILLRLMRRLTFHAADRVTAISSYLADYVRSRSKAHIDIIPNGVDISLYAPGQPKPDSSEKIIMSVSRLVPKNGLHNLIRALPHVLEKIPARLVLVGSGPLEDSLKELAVELQVAGAVDFVGSVPPDQLPKYLRSADVFVRPSISEGLGTAFLEAMATKIPVVAGRVGGIVDFLEHEQTGLFCDPKDPFDIAAQIVRLLSDVDLRSHIIERAWKMVHDKYDWDAVALSMGRVYKDMART